jgi:hypothetical protein
LAENQGSRGDGPVSVVELRYEATKLAAFLEDRFLAPSRRSCPERPFPSRRKKPVMNSAFRRRAMRALLWVAVGSTLFGGVGLATAQTQDNPVAAVPSTEVPEVPATPSPAAPLSEFAQTVDSAAAASATESPLALPSAVPPNAWTAGNLGLLGMIRESMWGNQKDRWKTMPLSTFFSEGWLEPWYYYPRSTTGAPRQAWINAYDGVFYRLWLLQFSYANNFQKNGNAYLGSYTIFTPISQRFQLLFSIPFIDSNKGGLSNTYHGNVGDFAVSPRFLLSETQDFSQVVECIVRTPTGSTVNGNGQTTLTPQYEFWYGGLPGAGVIRGGTGVTVPTNSAGVPVTVAGTPTTVSGSRTTVNYNLAVGKYWTPHDAKFGDLVTYLSVNGYTTVDNRGPLYSYLSVTPGVRFHLTNDYYFTAGIEVPLTGPKDLSFTYSPILWLVKVW